MKEYIITNQETIGMAIGFIFIVFVIIFSKSLMDSKWGNPIGITLLILGMFKFMDIIKSIFMFLLK